MNPPPHDVAAGTGLRIIIMHFHFLIWRIANNPPVTSSFPSFLRRTKIHAGAFDRFRELHARIFAVPSIQESPVQQQPATTFFFRSRCAAAAAAPRAGIWRPVWLILERPVLVSLQLMRRVLFPLKCWSPCLQQTPLLQIGHDDHQNLSISFFPSGGPSSPRSHSQIADGGLDFAFIPLPPPDSPAHVAGNTTAHVPDDITAHSVTDAAVRMPWRRNRPTTPMEAAKTRRTTGTLLSAVS